MTRIQADREFIKEFLSVYRSLPALWDLRNRDYFNREKKRTQYKILLQKYRTKFPNAEKQDVIKKNNCLRTNFRKAFKRQDVKLWYFEEMKFILQKTTPQTTNFHDDVITAAEWMMKLKKMNSKQKNFAQKAINDILREENVVSLCV